MRPRYKRKLRLLRLPFEWLGIGLGLAIFTILTRRGLLRLCDFVSRVMYLFDSRGRGYAMVLLQFICYKMVQNLEQFKKCLAIQIFLLLKFMLKWNKIGLRMCI